MNAYISIIKEKIVRHKTLVENFSYLSALQVFNMVLPLITYPYLIRVLGAEQYGLVIYAQVVSAYLGILIDYGFRTSATKDISVSRDDKNEVSKIVSSVFTIKLFLWLIAFAILLVMIFLMPALRKEKLLFIFSFGLCFNELLFPQWYFQGIERMKYITIINLITRTLFLCLIFLVIQEKSDYLYVPLLNGVGALTGGILGLYVLFVQDDIKFSWQPWSILKHYLKESSPLFGTNAIISIKDRFNVIFIGSLLGMKEVLIYDLATKIMNIIMQPIDIINNTIYPKVARDKNMSWVVATIKKTFILSVVMVLLIQPLLPTIINYLGKGLADAVLPARLLLIVPVIISISQGLAKNVIIANGKYKQLTLSIICTTVFYALLISMIHVVPKHPDILTFVLLTISVYFFELIYRMILVKRLNLLK